MQPRQSQGEQTVLSFVVEDTHSPIEHVEYSLAPDEWQVVYPVDGIPDSRVERFELSVDLDETAQVVIRATDALGNTATTLGR